MDTATTIKKTVLQVDAEHAVKVIEAARQNGNGYLTMAKNLAVIIAWGLKQWRAGRDHARRRLASLRAAQASEVNRIGWARVGASLAKDPQALKDLDNPVKSPQLLEAEQAARAAVESMGVHEKELKRLAEILGELAPNGDMTTDEFCQAVEKVIVEFRVSKDGIPV